MVINTNTKISKILKHNPGALEAIISIDAKFEKLRNPVLRRLMAARTSIGMASRIGGFSVERFYEKLSPLGFEIDELSVPDAKEQPAKLPAFFTSLSPEQITSFDVRPIMDAGKDPLSLIVEKVKNISAGGVLKIINSFSPTPLISLLKKQGFEAYVDVIDDTLVETYFYKTGDEPVVIEEKNSASDGWDIFIKKFENKIQTIDVRQLEMPMPMMTILESLEKLPEDKALFVYHKRIPVFLLPELRERKFDYRVKEIGANEVHLLIFKE